MHLDKINISVVGDNIQIQLEEYACKIWKNWNQDSFKKMVNIDDNRGIELSKLLADILKSYRRAALKVMRPILFCWPTMSEMNVSGAAPEDEASN